jgi:tetratricopeptide (TPR) repeat protein
MKRSLYGLLFCTILFSVPVAGQTKADYSKIDIMLIHGEYNRVIDTCRLILSADSLNSEIYFRMGLAHQNILPDDKSLEFFQKAFALAPENKEYKFMVAKGLLIKNKNKEAKPLLQDLYASDSLNWSYAYYLTSIYMQEGKYPESIEIYNRFYQKDSTNYIYLDKLGFANLRYGYISDAIDLFNKSLAINKNNSNAIKNLAYLYSVTHRIDTAIILLTRAIVTDPTDIDLFERRAALYFSTNNNKRALNDYLKIIGSGDSSVLYLKRAGIGYTNNFQPAEGNVFLLLANKKDSTDGQVLNILAENYKKLHNLKKSEEYYNKLVRLLVPFSETLEFTYVNLAEEYKSGGEYNKAIEFYLKGQRMGPDMNINMIIANIYDENIKNIPKAIHYYQLFLDGLREDRINEVLKDVKPDSAAFTTSDYRIIQENNRPETFFSPEYIKAVKSRLEFLKEKELEKQKKQPAKKK